MVQAMIEAATNGGDQAIAATRGDGKTTIAECVISLLICWGVLRFPAIFSATGRDAEQILANIKSEFEMNDQLHGAWPEICEPIRRLEGAPQRAAGQTVKQVRTRMQWSGDGVRFPTVPGSKASGALLKTRGLDGAIRGVREGAQRPDFALIDDPDTEESAESASQQEKRENAIERAIGGLGGPGQKFGRLMLCTLINSTCLAARYTSPKVKPSWRGKRFQFLQEKPHREDLWDEYIHLRQSGFDPNSDVKIDAAHKFYLSNRSVMDAGHRVSNDRRFNRLAFPPESSALEHFYNQVADKGWGSVLTELQNDPPAEDADKTTGITPALIQKRLNGYPMNVVPHGRLALTTYIDVGYADTKGLHFVTAAWYAGARGCVIEHGVQELNNARGDKERAVMNALHSWREERLREPYRDEDGVEAFPDVVFVDSGDGQLTATICQFVRDAGHPFRASKGFGSGKGQSPFRLRAATKTLRVGDHWFESWQPESKLWLVGLDVDHWKEWVHDRFLTEHMDEDRSLRPGSLSLFTKHRLNTSTGAMEIDPRWHHSFAEHICSEGLERVFVEGKGMTKRMVRHKRNNDWLDCMAGASCAARMCGVTLSTVTLAAPQQFTKRGTKMKTPDGRPYLASRR